MYVCMYKPPAKNNGQKFFTLRLRHPGAHVFSANARTNASARIEKYSNRLVDVCVCLQVVHSRCFLL